MSADPLQLLGLSGGVDKNGVISIDVPVWVATLAEAIRHVPKLDLGVPCVSRSFKQSDEGGYEVAAHFEGLDPSGTQPGEDQVTFEFDVSMSEDPIESHPNFDAIAEKYGWDETERAFPKFPPGTTSEGSALSKKSKVKKNPLYGTESFLAMGAIFRKTYVARSIPEGVLRGIGGIVERPPDIGQFHIPSTGGKRNWLKLAPKIRRRGNSVEITEEWMLSGPNGWNKDVYSAGQLDGGGDSSGGGLHTGGLTTGTL
jgi:hypothetical protein